MEQQVTGGAKASRVEGEAEGELRLARALYRPGGDVPPVALLDGLLRWMVDTFKSSLLRVPHVSH